LDEPAHVFGIEALSLHNDRYYSACPCGRAGIARAVMGPGGGRLTAGFKCHLRGA
jgi:hypothetical protein